MVILRIGECRRCGKCCIKKCCVGKENSFYDVLIKFNYFKLRLPGEYNKKRIQCCEKLAFDIQTRKAICLVHDRKPKLCYEYPPYGVPIIPGCGYRFIAYAPRMT